MEKIIHEKSLSEQRSLINKLIMMLSILSIVLLLLTIKHATQSEIVILKTPGLPTDSVLEKTSMDKMAQMATLFAFTNNLAQINPSNAEYVKAFLQVYLSAEAYTRIADEINQKVAKLQSSRELGSYYFVLAKNGYKYDSILDRHFVMGNVHVVNAATDTSTPWVFEYKVKVENYRLVIEDVLTYEGDKPHDAEYERTKKRNEQ